MINFNFHGIDNVSDIRLLIGFLSKQDLGYPNYQDWVQRAEVELDQGYKQAILAFSDNKLIGNLVYQWHKGMQGLLELKNLRLAPSITGRGFARFLLKQIEADHPSIPIICDLRSTQTDIYEVFLKCGYIPTAKLSIYDSNHEDIVMTKLGARGVIAATSESHRRG